MEPSSHEPAPELPRPERNVSSRIDNLEVVESPNERIEQAMPGERISKANDVVSQIAAAPLSVPDDRSLQAVIPQTDDSQTPQIADDVDVIEKEWVQKAKEIVSGTKDDPREQTIQISNFKHDYIKKRYGKEIKLPADIRK